MIVPSPPGMLKLRPSARASSSASTPTATRKIAASTNDTSPNALMLCELMTPVLRFRLCSPYQGRNIVTSSAIAAIAAIRRSRSSVAQASESRVIASPAAVAAVVRDPIAAKSRRAIPREAGQASGLVTADRDRPAGRREVAREVARGDVDGEGAAAARRRPQQPRLAGAHGRAVGPDELRALEDLDRDGRDLRQRDLDARARAAAQVRASAARRPAASSRRR